ncbi:hypothetical protein LEP1GSC040_3532 [Leptospira santarosai str. 2000030832]|nr:hypothetical protein LEP1GSC040_3532 [Leptospira santarosai str. 2000030832]
MILSRNQKKNILSILFGEGSKSVPKILKLNSNPTISSFRRLRSIRRSCHCKPKSNRSRP